MKSTTTSLFIKLYADATLLIKYARSARYFQFAYFPLLLFRRYCVFFFSATRSAKVPTIRRGTWIEFFILPRPPLSSLQKVHFSREKLHLGERVIMQIPATLRLFNETSRERRAADTSPPF